MITKNNVNTFFRLFLLFMLSYISGFLCYLPFYSALIISALVSVFAWYRIALISDKIRNKKAKTILNILPFYKAILYVIGYGVIYLPDIINLPQLNIFTELDSGLAFTWALTQINPFEFKLITFSNSTLAIALSIALSVIFSLIPILSYYLVKQKNKTIRGRFSD